MALGPEITLLANDGLASTSIKSFLDCCKAADTKNLWYLEGTARQLLSDSLRAAGLPDLASREANLSEQLFRQAPVPSQSNHKGIELAFSKIRSSEGNHGQKILEWIDFLNVEEFKRDLSNLQSALLEVADVTASILKLKKDPNAYTIFWNFQNQAESYLEQQRNLFKLYLYHSTADDVYRLYGEEGAILNWHNDFHAKYPQFNLPKILDGGYRRRKGIYERLKDWENIRRITEELQQCLNQDRYFWKEKLEGGIPREAEMAGTNRVQNSTQLDRGKYWHSEWSDDLLYLDFDHDLSWNSHGGTEETDLPRDGSSPFLTRNLKTNTWGPNSTFATLIRWMQEALRTGDLSKESLKQVLRSCHGQQCRQEVDNLLSDISPQDLSRHFSTMSTSDWGPTFAILSVWLLEKCKHMETKRQYLLAYLQHMRSITVHSLEYKIIEVERMFDVLGKINDEAARSFRVCLPIYRNSLARARKMILNRNAEESGLCDENSDPVKEILQLYHESLKECRAAGDLRMEASTLGEIAQMYFMPASKMRPVALQCFFSTADVFEAALQRLREGWKVLPMRAKVEKLLLAVETDYKCDLTSMGIHLNWLISEASSDQKDLYIWFLIQRMKSRGFAWLMQDNATIVRERATQTIDNLRPIGANSLNSCDQLKFMATSSGGDVVFVDWYSTLGGAGLPYNPILATSRNGSAPKIWSTTISWKEAEKVIEEFKKLTEDKEDMKDKGTYKLLQRLQPLIEPLAQASKPGETLVFCPIGEMSRIPLHAIELDGQILIHRNPLVYCSSLAALKVTYEARKFCEYEREEQKRQAKYLPWTTSFFGAPLRPESQESFQALAMRLSAHFYTKDSFTSSNFSNAIRNGTSLLHYHGHGHFQTSDPLSQYLDFSTNPFTIGDAYDLAPAPTSYHATLLACGSGATRASVSNEIVGLVPAFLYAGASSTVSALWPFEDEDAQMFSEVFYEEMGTLRAGGGGTVDLAKALRRAVLAIKGIRGELYSWAPFVLNGYWMLRVDGMGKREEGEEEREEEKEEKEKEKANEEGSEGEDDGGDGV